jgi:hypothetical protein
MLGFCMIKISTLVLILVFTVSLAANSSLIAPYYFAGDDYFQFDKSIADWFATRGIWRIVGIPLLACIPRCICIRSNCRNCRARNWRLFLFSRLPARFWLMSTA